MKIEKYRIPCRLYIFWLNIPVSLTVQQSSKNIRCRIYMPTYTSSQLYSTQYGITFIHIGTLEAFSHTFCYIFSNSGSYFTVFSHYKSQKSACSTSASGKTDIRQGSKNDQAVVKQSSGSGQAIIRQWLGNQLRSQCATVDSVSDVWPKILQVFGSNMNLIAPFIG